MIQKLSKIWGDNQIYVFHVYWNMAILCKKFAKKYLEQKRYKSYHHPK